MNEFLWALGGLYVGMALMAVVDGSSPDSFFGRWSRRIAGTLALPFALVAVAPDVVSAIPRRFNFLVAWLVIFKLRNPRLLGWWYSIRPRVVLGGDAYVPSCALSEWDKSDGPIRSRTLRRRVSRDMGRQLAEQALAYASENPGVSWHVVLVRVNWDGPRVWVSRWGKA